jgi:hypothetical protein
MWCVQNDNVANQREHLVLLLANAQSRLGVLVDSEQNKVPTSKQQFFAVQSLNFFFPSFVGFCPPPTSLCSKENS